MGEDLRGALRRRGEPVFAAAAGTTTVAVSAAVLELLDAYAQPARGYHDLRHLAEILDRVDELVGVAAAPDEAVAAGRSVVLRGLVGRRQLFRTDAGRARWETAARANVAAELADLASLATRERPRP